MSESSFFQDLAMLMAVAGLAAVVCTRFRWPKVIGYLLAGVLLSKYTWGSSFIADERSVQTIGQLGVVFLMFSMGLGFSTTTIKKVGNVAFPTAILDTVVMTWLGFTIGRSVLGWDVVPSLFLGVAICDSATTMLSKVIGEIGWGDRPFVKNVLGTSICEDIVCVGLVALATGVAKGTGMSIGAVATSLGGLGVFFAATLFFGMAFVPKFLNSLAKRGDNEALLLTLLGCGFFVTFIAYKLDFSLALGAFLIGIVGAGSDVRGRLHYLTQPLQTMFAAVFFVSVGLLVNPFECWRCLPIILMLSVVVVVGKFLNCFIGSIITGEDIKTSVQTGMSLAQIGEFAFMIALLYVTITGDMEKPMYQIVIGVSLLTTIINPLLLRASDSVGNFMEMKCPAKLRSALDGYRGFLQEYRVASKSKRTEHHNIRKAIGELVFVGVLAFAVALTTSALNERDWSSLSVFFDSHKQLFFMLAMNALLTVFLTVVSRIARTLAKSISVILTGNGNARWQRTICNAVHFVVISIVMILAVCVILMINFHFFPTEVWERIPILILFVIGVAIGWRHFVRAGKNVVENFTEALKTDDRLAKISKQITFSVPEGHVVRIAIPSGSPAIGATVGSLNIRAKTGTIVVEVMRNGESIKHIGADFAFKEGDAMVVIGEAAQVAALRALLKVEG